MQSLKYKKINSEYLQCGKIQIDKGLKKNGQSKCIEWKTIRNRF